MNLELSQSLNDTFSIEEEESFLNNFGTPIHFRKLMDKPADIRDCSLTNFMNIPNSPLPTTSTKFLNPNESSLLSRLNINDKENEFSLPQSAKRKVGFHKRKSIVSRIDSPILSPIAFGDKKNRMLTPISTNFIVESTPNVRREQRKLDYFPNQPQKSIIDSTKSVRFQSPERVIDLEEFSGSSVTWSLNRRKVDAEKAKLEKERFEQIKKEKENERILNTPIDYDLAAEKLQKFKLQIRKYKPNFDVDVEVKKDVSQTGTTVVKPEVVVDPITTTPISQPSFLRQRFLEKKAEYEAERIQNEKSKPNKSISNNNQSESDLPFEERQRLLKEVCSKIKSYVDEDGDLIMTPKIVPKPATVRTAFVTPKYVSTKNANMSNRSMNVAGGTKSAKKQQPMSTNTPRWK